MNLILRTGFLLILSSSLVSCHIKKPKAGLNGFNNEVSNIISNKCYSCHSGGNAEGDLGYIDNANSLISRGYVVPGSPANSAIYQKVTSPTFGARMPYGGPYLNSAEITTIANWISSLGSSGSGACVPHFVTGDPSFAIDVKPLFDTVDYGINGASGKRCIACHYTGGFAGAKAVFAPSNTPGAATYENIAGANAGLLPYTGRLVVPGDPCNSRLYRRISQSTKPLEFTENAAALWLMPYGAAIPDTTAANAKRHLTDHELGIIFTWILNGAKNN